MARDAVATMGAILPDDVGGRDAVHVAVIAVKASGNRIYPGAEVGVKLTAEGYIASPTMSPHVGIVDPFIKGAIGHGARFWLYLYPRSITGLNHSWTHPEFPDTDALPLAGGEASASERWLREFIASADCPDYDDMINILKRIADGEMSGQIGESSDDWSGYRFDGDMLHFNGFDAHGSIPAEFWVHAEAVIGKPITKGEKPEYFSCSC
jgi:hypothetical protein